MTLLSDFTRHSPGEIGDHNPGESVDKTEDGDCDEGEPPEPEGEEVLLVEDVVVEDAKVVTPVDGTSSGTNTDVAGDLGDKIVQKRITKLMINNAKAVKSLAENNCPILP